MHQAAQSREPRQESYPRSVLSEPQGVLPPPARACGIRFRCNSSARGLDAVVVRLGGYGGRGFGYSSLTMAIVTGFVPRELFDAVRSGTLPPSTGWFASGAANSGRRPLSASSWATATLVRAGAGLPNGVACRRASTGGEFLGAALVAVPDLAARACRRLVDHE